MEKLPSRDINKDRAYYYDGAASPNMTKEELRAQQQMRRRRVSSKSDTEVYGGSFDSSGTPATPNGMGTPYSTSMGSVSSYSSGGENYYSENDVEAFDPMTDMEKAKTMLRKARSRASQQQQQQQQGKKMRISQNERDFLLRLEREWREEDAWAHQPGSWYSTLLWLPVLIWLRCFNVFLSIFFWPVSFVARNVFGIQMKYSPFWDVPLERRKQTAVVMLFVGILPCVMISYAWSIILLIFPLTTFPMLCYYIYIFYVDKSPETGTRRPYIRYWKLWRHFASYFPLRLVKTTNLDPSRKYVFCYHPHGIISLGAFGNFATDATGFSRKFPGIDLRLLTLEINFYCPWVREFLLHMGICSASKRSCNKILQKGPGNAIMLVVGGAAESLETEPGTYRLTLGRKGFVRVALDNGADLVPVLAFGENDVFDTVYYPPNSFGRNIQEWVRKKLGFATPIFFGRGMFNYTLGVLPHRKPIIVVVGKPIRLPRIPPHLKGDALSTTAEGVALVDKYHQKYIQSLRTLWDSFKSKLAIHRQGSLQLAGVRMPPRPPVPRVPSSEASSPIRREIQQQQGSPSPRHQQGSSPRKPQVSPRRQHLEPTEPTIMEDEEQKKEETVSQED